MRSVRTMRSWMLVGLALLLGTLAAGAAYGVSGVGRTEVRITAERLADGRVELGLEQRRPDGAWAAVEPPEQRFLEPQAEPGARFHTDAIVLEVELEQARAAGAAGAYRGYLLESGVQIAERYNERFTDPEHPQLVPGLFLCLVDPHDAGIEALCAGLESAYRGAVVRIAQPDWAGLRSELRARLAVQAPVAVLATSVPTALLAIEERARARHRPPISYWIELLDQHLAPSEARFCQVAHSGTLVEDETDLFWGLSGEISAAAAAQLGLRLEFSAHTDAGAQAAAIRECAAGGAAAIATTLVEPEALGPALAEARAAGVPVVSFNSGTERARELGAALHIALDDRAAGRLAGEEFNRRGVSGRALCLLHEPDNVGLQQRCAGFAETYRGQVERWSAADPAALREELAARLGRGDLSALLALSVHSAWDARSVRARDGLELPIAAFGFSAGLVRAVLEGSVLFTLLDHPELQAYLSAAAALIAERWRLDPAAYFDGAALLIRPQIADAAYMQRLVDTLYAE